MSNIFIIGPLGLFSFILIGVRIGREWNEISIRYKIIII